MEKNENKEQELQEQLQIKMQENQQLQAYIQQLELTIRVLSNIINK